jgi:hypothetical protein
MGQSNSPANASIGLKPMSVALVDYESWLAKKRSPFFRVVGFEGRRQLFFHILFFYF